jgi:SAM-dependent methyltransferase
MLLRTLAVLIGAVGGLHALNYLSYSILKRRILRSRPAWGLNICCGKTDGGGVNADIVKHSDVPRFVQVNDIYNLPFVDGEFETVLCSHTIEHVDDPAGFFLELKRVGRDVTLVVPPLWDLSAALNLLEHRWLFLTLRKRHESIPRYVPLPGARTVQRWLGQRIHA